MKEYIPKPIDTSTVNLPDDILDNIEVFSRNIHEVWAYARTTEGWKYGDTRNDEHKLHPCLIPYYELTEEEKEYDIITSLETLKILILMGYEIKKRTI